MHFWIIASVALWMEVSSEQAQLAIDKISQRIGDSHLFSTYFLGANRLPRMRDGRSDVFAGGAVFTTAAEPASIATPMGTLGSQVS